MFAIVSLSAVSASDDFSSSLADDSDSDILAIDDIAQKDNSHKLMDDDVSVEFEIDDEEEGDDDLEDDTSYDSYYDDSPGDDWSNYEDYDPELISEDAILTKIEVLNVPSHYGDDNISFRLIDLNTGLPIPDVNLGLQDSYDYDVYSFFTDEDGVVVYPIPVKVGDFSVVIGFYEDMMVVNELDDMVCNFTKLNVSIPTVPASIKITKTGTYYNDTVLKVSLVSSVKEVLSNQKINLTFSNGKKATVKTNSKGIANYALKFAPGSYSVTAALVSDGIVEANKSSLKNIKIIKAPGTLSPTALSTTYASGKYFQIKLTNSKTKKAIGGVKLNLKVYTGKKYKTVTVTTGANGIAKYSASTLSVGTHKVIVTVKDTKYVSASSKTSFIKISKASRAISAPKVTAKYKSSSTFKVTVKNKASKKILSGVQVSLKVYTGKKFKTYNVKTNSKGVASFNTKSLTKANHKVIVNIKASANYNAASATSYINIK